MYNYINFNFQLEFEETSEIMEYIEKSLKYGYKRHVCLDRIHVDNPYAVIYVSSIGGASMTLYTEVKDIDRVPLTAELLGINVMDLLVWSIYPKYSNPKDNVDLCLSVIHHLRSCRRKNEPDNDES